ncbi:MAG TPA: hypothetical protein VK053_04270 [Jiangellaceae bacterium]|nr:hypothetical protein [Jiangellaceae bacterium]
MSVFIALVFDVRKPFGFGDPVRVDSKSFRQDLHAVTHIRRRSSEQLIEGVVAWGQTEAHVASDGRHLGFVRKIAGI